MIGRETDRPHETVEQTFRDLKSTGPAHTERSEAQSTPTTSFLHLS